MNNKKYPCAFCLVEYQCKAGCCCETIWCNGDLKVPQVVLHRRTKHQMNIVDPNGGLFVPRYDPKPGTRVFVQATKELVKDVLEKYLREQSQYLAARYPNCDQGAIKREVSRSWTAEGMPWLVVIASPDVVYLKAGAIFPFVCPSCRQTIPYDEQKVAHQIEIHCTCGFSGLPDAFSEVEFEIQTTVH